jgi:hypothetical protein
MSRIDDTAEQIDDQRRCFFGTAAMIVSAAWLAAATFAITSPAFARQHAAHLKGLNARTPAPRTQVTVDRNDPALTGGGSLGYNQRVEQGY